MLPLRVFFEAPTIADLAAALQEDENELAERAKLERILSEIENLSADEAHSALSNEFLSEQAEQPEAEQAEQEEGSD